MLFPVFWGQFKSAVITITVCMHILVSINEFISNYHISVSVQTHDRKLPKQINKLNTIKSSAYSYIVVWLHLYLVFTSCLHTVYVN